MHIGVEREQPELHMDEFDEVVPETRCIISIVVKVYRMLGLYGVQYSPVI